MHEQRPRSVRLVSWNIEKGKRWSSLLPCLDVEEIRTADILCLNEVDHGMARSQNKDIAREIAERLGMLFVFGPVYREFTKGIAEEKLAPGENTIGIQGNAILTRFPIRSHRNIQLHICCDAMQREEKREGGRCGLIAELECGEDQYLTVANTHLEVMTTRECRRLQMKSLLRQLGTGPAVLAGDLNTNSFDRGNMYWTIRSALRLLATDFQPQVLDPTSIEPLFDELSAAGFDWKGFNDDYPTCSVDLGTLEDQKYIPGFVRRAVLRRVQGLPLKLDWIAGRNVRPLSPGRTLRRLPAQPSDHLPIMCDLEIG